MLRLLCMLLAALALVAAGCGDDDGGDAGPGEGSVVAPTTPEATVPGDRGIPDTDPPAIDGETGGTGATGDAGGDAGAGVQIGMRDIRFNPEQATVKVGEPVTWTNNESVPHNVVAQEGADFESDTFGEGGTFTYTPEQAGTISYVCTIHPGMDGTLTVEE